MAIVEIIKLAKKVIKDLNVIIFDPAISYDDLVSELVLHSLLMLEKFKHKSKQSTFLYTTMKNHLINLGKKHHLRTHDRIPDWFDVPEDSFFEKWELLTSNEQIIVRDILLLFENGADLREIKKRFQIIYKKEWKGLKEKVQRW